MTSDLINLTFALTVLCFEITLLCSLVFAYTVNALDSIDLVVEPASLVCLPSIDTAVNGVDAPAALDWRLSNEKLDQFFTLTIAKRAQQGRDCDLYRTIHQRVLGSF